MHSLEQRLEAATATMDLRLLWPDVPLAELDRAHATVARVTRAALAGAAGPHDLTLPPALSPRALGIAAFVSGLGPLLGYWVEIGQVHAEPASAEVLAAHLDHGRRRWARLREELGRVLAALGERGVRATVLKGADTALRYFPEPACRPMADLDVLVRAAEAHVARACISGLGFVEVNAEMAPQRSEWLLPDSDRTPRSVELTHVDNPWRLDLHYTLDRSLVPGRTVGLGVPTLADQRDCPELGPAARRLAPPLALAFLAFHAASHLRTTQLLRLVELALVTRREFRELNAWDAFEDLIRRTGTARFMFAPLDLAERFIPGTVPPGVRAGLTAATPLKVRRAAARMSPDTFIGVAVPMLRDRLLWVATPGDLLASLAHVVWPLSPRGPLPPRAALPVLKRRLRRLLHRGRGH